MACDDLRGAIHSPSRDDASSRASCLLDHHCNVVEVMHADAHKNSGSHVVGCNICIGLLQCHPIHVVFVCKGDAHVEARNPLEPDNMAGILFAARMSNGGGASPACFLMSQMT